MADERWSLRDGELSAVEAEFGIPLKTVCLPLNLEHFRENIVNGEGWNADYVELLESEPAEYPNDIVDMVSGLQRPESGSYFDVSLSSLFGSEGFLVRMNGDRVGLNAETFRGKYVPVCCFYVPVAYGGESSESVQALLKFCHQLYSTRDDFEVVMVAWVNTLVDAEDHRKVFDHFFSVFPESCLAVPFEDSERRAYLCRLLAGTTYDEFSSSPCHVLDPKGIVVAPFQRDVHHFFGADAFPFTEEILDDIKVNDRYTWLLSDLLRVSEFSPDYVYRFNPEGGPPEEVKISALDEKLVGVYLPQKGNLIPTLLNVYQECRKQELEFEILVGYRGCEPELVRERIERMMRNHDTCRRWWCLPLDTSVSLQLWRFTRGCYADRLVVCSSRYFDEPLDLYAGKVMEIYGVAGYPFTRDAILEREVQRLKGVTMESVLLGDAVVRGNNPDDVIPAENLSYNHMVCIFFSSRTNSDVYEKALAAYHDLKQNEPDFEVIYVHAMDDLGQVEQHSQTISEMPWYICPSNAARTASLAARLRLSEAIIAFDFRGQVCACRPPPHEFEWEDVLYLSTLYYDVRDGLGGIGYNGFESDTNL